MAAFPRQEAMEVDEATQCTPEEIWQFLIENNLDCSFRVLGNQLGLSLYDLKLLEETSPADQLLIRILQKCSERELLSSWKKIEYVLRRPALKQYRIANKIRRTHILSRSSISEGSEADSASSLQSQSGSLSIEDSLPCVDPEAEPEIPDVVNEIAEVVNWEKLGLMLGLSVDEMDTIRTSYKQNEHHQRLAELWWRKGGECTWSKLLTQLDKLYPRRKSSISVTSPAPESLDIESQIRTFESKFKELVIEARKELEEKYNKKSIEVVKDQLKYLPSEIKLEYHKFVSQLTSRKRPFQNLNKLFDHLYLYCWNFFEYSALENLIQNKCSDELKEKMLRYAEEIKSFRRRTTITEFIKCQKLPLKRTSIPPRFIDVTMEHAIDPDTYTLAELDHFRKDMYAALRYKLSDFAFQVYRIVHGSVIVQWMVPEEFATPLRDLFYSESGQELLQKNSVEMVSIDENEIPIQSLFLITAVKNGDVPQVQALLEDKRVDIDFQLFPDGPTALHFAATKGHVEIAELLLKKGCDVSVFAGEEGRTPLQAVCLLEEKPSERHNEIVKLLLEHGASLTYDDLDGRTPLFAASKNGFVDIVKILLEAISKLPKYKQEGLLNHKMLNGWSILMDAAMHGHADVIRLLIEAGAMVILTKEVDHETALHIAAYHGYVDVVKALTEKQDRFVVNARDDYGLTPLMMATIQRHMEVANILLEAGADVNLQSNNEERRTALMYAAKHGSKEIIQLLWKYKPSVSIRDSKNKTVFDIANTPEILRCLRELRITKPEVEIGVKH